MSILQVIIAAKRLEVAKRKKNHPINAQELERSNKDFKKAIAGKNQLSLIAEIKRASPSEGVIRDDFEPITCAQSYEFAGASAISVLTDERFFKGHLDILAMVGKAVSLPVLRKDFIIDEYQILEARKYGADAILLIATILTDKEIKRFIGEARKFNMDALVEVHNEKELKRALGAGAEIIGINNRDLTTFKIDLTVTRTLSRLIPEDKIVVAESGVYGRVDVAQIRGVVDAMLVGTSIMKAENPIGKIHELLDDRPLVKICGIKDKPAAQACEGKADIAGLNFVRKSHRYVNPTHANDIRDIFEKTKVAGIFQNEKLEFVNRMAKELKLDFIQLHGSESPEYCAKVIRPVIRAMPASRACEAEKYTKNIAFILIDGEKPGSGHKPKPLMKKKPPASLNPLLAMCFLAGGLNPRNVASVIRTHQPLGVDVASGVETDGKKDPQKIREFIAESHK